MQRGWEEEGGFCLAAGGVSGEENFKKRRRCIQCHKLSFCWCILKLL